MNGNRSRTLQTHNRDIINILLTSSSQSVLYVTDPRFFPYDLWPARLMLGPQIKGEKTWSVTYGTDLELGEKEVFKNFDFSESFPLEFPVTILLDMAIQGCFWLN